MKRIISLIFLILLVAGTIFILSRSKYQTSQGEIFGTTYHVRYNSTQNLDKEIEQELFRVDTIFSLFKENSLLSRFNRGEDKGKGNTLFAEVIKLSLEISNETEGAFDITVAPLVNAWGFGFKNKQPLSNQQVDSLQKLVGYQHLSFNGKELTKDIPNLQIDCGAIAKGYAVDRIAKLLSDKGCQNYMVEIGGEVVVKGNNDKGEKWKIGINKPTQHALPTEEDLQTLLSLTNCGIATSGNYRNFYIKDGKKYAHSIDPKTGYPVQHSLLSATVISQSCAKSDALATAFMVMGLDKAKAFVETHKDIQVYFIYADEKGNYQVWMSDGMKPLIDN
ncbi:FAD:protein FMN transferase [Alloprevotella sp. oral taxon 473]|jgi:ApbE family protein|uniref:FAD:protein FMN transferase n=1 Tax=Alloprevotella sp. oral taxon 473 TaxID=712469 RepID=UPI0002A2B72D|nr:FAD:protein FMN transferase [Alloprevotella sp. oral taxon 473]EKX88648.1 ApbE family protein [Alloprevotella sp. oral taxon 473 str. F0040]